jgi:hypothetical protein
MQEKNLEFQNHNLKFRCSVFHHALKMITSPALKKKSLSVADPDLGSRFWANQESGIRIVDNFFLDPESQA